MALIGTSTAMHLGCATVEPVAVGDFNNPKGIPYYDGSFYLLIYPDGKGNATWALEYAMDPLQKMEYRTTNFLANSTGTIEFDKGLLSSAATTSDSTALVKTIVKAIGAVVSALANRGDHGVDQPRVYKVKPIPDGLEFIGTYDEPDIIRVNAPITTLQTSGGDK